MNILYAAKQKHALVSSVHALHPNVEYQDENGKRPGFDAYTYVPPLVPERYSAFSTSVQRCTIEYACAAVVIVLLQLRCFYT